MSSIPAHLLASPISKTPQPLSGLFNLSPTWKLVGEAFSKYVCLPFNLYVLTPLDLVSDSLPQLAEKTGQKLASISFETYVRSLILSTRKLAPSLVRLGSGMSRFLLESTALLLVLFCSFTVLQFLCSWICTLFHAILSIWRLTFRYMLEALFGAEKENKKITKTMA
ncbi:hypothetical protein [Candidatus Similichlamydia laticola]|uniref:Uncharacterized protein n=1 Tax=Candidatus Similichlamydia laticola TaxID=2170265 RepID=A0A369KJR2_9BACT|nr:hypothetical protein [Candidatus Similichlamydia laticola]RDB31216.1 hypothetical protein HAT2_00696 [Candidatus Similichlamydia laticola]